MSVPVTRFPEQVRFGEYVLDLRNRELLKRGIPLHLQERPLQILSVLLENPGQVITREELRRRLWPSDTFVDFDHSISTAVRKLRNALNDSAAAPRYIATVDRRGYRFIYPVERGPAHNLTVIEGWPLERVDEGTEPAVFPIRVIHFPRHHGWRRALLPVFACVGLLVAVSYSWTEHREPHITQIVQLTHSGRVHPNQNLLTDGLRLYYIEEQGAESPRMKTIAVEGGEPVDLPSPLPRLDLQDISPNGAEMLVRNLQQVDESELWSVPLPSGSPRRVGELWGHDFTFSPDGKQVGFTHGNTVNVANADGTTPRKLAEFSGTPQMLRWSRNLDLLRVTIFDAEHSSFKIWNVPISGNATPALEGSVAQGLQQAGGSWTKDGHFFVFSSRDDGQKQRDLWLSEEDVPWWRRAHGLRQLTNGPISFWRPVFSRDGDTIFAVGWQARGELVSYEPASGRYDVFLHGISAENVAFSPNGEWVAYVRFPDGTLWRSRVDGSEQLQLTFAPFRAVMPRWSPDGTQILFSGTRNLSDWRIYVIQKDGDGLNRVLTDETPQQHADWSPDGTKIVVGKPRREQDGSGHRLQLFDMTKKSGYDIPGTENLWYPTWSPDGRYIAALEMSTDMIVCFDTRNGRSIGALRKGSSPVWSHDGRYLYFAVFDPNEQRVFRFNVKTKTVEQVLNDPAFRWAGRWGGWLGLTPESKILLLRDRSESDIYALHWKRR